MALIAVFFAIPFATAAAAEVPPERQVDEYLRSVEEDYHPAHHMLGTSFNSPGYHGGFNEYNSPTYTMVALWECERTLHLVRDEPTREAAEALRRIAWETIAESFHPATGQWAGPHSRAYHDRLSQSTARYLADQTGAEILVHSTQQNDGRTGSVDLFRHLTCPEDLCPRFAKLPSEPLEVRRAFVRDSQGEPNVAPMLETGEPGTVRAVWDLETVLTVAASFAP